MQEDPHYPSRWTVLTVFIVLFMMIAGVFAWAFYFNFGTLVMRSDGPFRLQVRGENYDCTTTCEVSLPPGDYDALVQKQGYFDETLRFFMPRWQTVEAEVSFRLIPYVETLDSLEDLPDQDAASYELERSGEEWTLLDLNNERDVTLFLSLQDPQIDNGGDVISVLDQERVFFVDKNTGRKQRRFGEEVVVEHVDVSPEGKRSLLFVEAEDQKQVWIWFHESNELQPLSWYADPEFVKWDPSSDYKLFVVSDQIQPQGGAGTLFDEVLESAQIVENPLALLHVNLDTRKADEVFRFSEESEKPTSLELRQGRLFMIFAERAQEVVFRKLNQTSL